MPLWVRLPMAVALLVLGAVIGVLSVAVHGLVVGLVLIALATGATAAALPGGWSTRLPFAVGWWVVVFLGGRPRPEGDLLILADARGYTLLGLGVLLLLFCTMTMRRHPDSVPPTAPPTGAS